MSRTGPLVIARREFSSRLILGSGKYPDNDTFAQAAMILERCDN